MASYRAKERVYFHDHNSLFSPLLLHGLADLFRKYASTAALSVRRQCQIRRAAFPTWLHMQKATCLLHNGGLEGELALSAVMTDAKYNNMAKTINGESILFYGLTYSLHCML